MTKRDRQLVFDKYGGKCAYCGCELIKGWHVDELLPVVRNQIWDSVKRKWVSNKDKPMQYPERLHINNQMPSCGSCNRQKHSQSLEGFRQSIAHFVNSLNLYHNQYKFAKRYGLIQETGIEVKFYFEQFKPTTNGK